jgi:ribosome biogenesis GTPase
MSEQSTQRQPASIEDLGWRTFFSTQLTPQEQRENCPARVMAVHRDALVVHDGSDVRRVHLGRHWTKTAGQDKPTTGDWLLLDPAREWISRLLTRETVIKRVSAGVNAGQQTQEQAIAANIDILFVVTSCNNEFNESRLERYLTVAQNADIEPVIIISKCDLADAPDTYLARTKVVTEVPVVLVNALDPTIAPSFEPWLLSGQTIAMVGSSGVGKSTLLNTLAGHDIQETADIREVDQRGRHTTTHRSIHLLDNGALMLDTPGIREITFAFGQETLSDMFEDIEALIPQCKFSNCTHESEPGCAIKGAIETGGLELRRFENYQKMSEEESHNTQNMDEQRIEKRRFKNRKAGEGPRDAKKKRKKRI